MLLRTRRVAERIVGAKKNGDDVVVVVSAMGDTTDELLDQASQITADLEKLHEIEELSVDVTEYCDGSVHFQQVGLLSEHLGARVDDP